MTTLQQLIDEIKARCEKATPGPWDGKWAASGFPPYVRHPIIQVGANVHGYPEDQDCLANTKLQRDQEFIAHARTDIPRLVAALELSIGRLRGLGESYEDNGTMANWTQGVIREIETILSGADEKSGKGRGDE